jgi:hypothetical protein
MMNNINLLRDFLANSLAEDSGIWQMRLLSDRDLCNLAKDKGLSYWCLDEDIKRLWQIGLIRADLIVSKSEVEIEGIVFLKPDEYGNYIYKDTRKFIEEIGGLGGIFKKLSTFPSDIQLLFHPYRYFVLYEIEEKFKLNVSQILVLKNLDAFQKLTDSHIKLIQNWTTGEEFKKQFQKLNYYTDVAISCEPFTFQQLFGFHKVRVIDYDNPQADDEGYQKELEKYLAGFIEIFKAIGLKDAKDIHSKFCIEAQSMEPNIDIHRIIRFTEKDFRLKKVSGKLGGATYFLAMAEMVRRAAEKVFDTELPEEDEIGFFHGVGSSKKYKYGKNRIIDDLAARREFVRNYGLDYTIRLRWYVEGYTEFGALNSILGNHSNIELINLKGLIVAAGNKGLAFKENLLNDLKNAIYSWVTIDNDDQNCVNILLNAVKADEMFGMFFRSDPDFEFHNFAAGELAEIVWEWAQPFDGVEEGQKQKLTELTATTKSSGEFFKAVNQAIPYQPQICKGEVWGEKLIRYADQNPIKADTGNERPIIGAVRSALHSYDCNYQLARAEGKVDILTGNIVYPKIQGEL